MGYVYSGSGSLPDGKVDGQPLQGPAIENVTAAEWNSVLQAVKDIRAAMLALTTAEGRIEAAIVATDTLEGFNFFQPQFNDASITPGDVDMTGYAAGIVAIAAGQTAVVVTNNDIPKFKAAIVCPMDRDANVTKWSYAVTGGGSSITITVNTATAADMKFSYLKIAGV